MIDIGRKGIALALLLLLASGTAATRAFAHCQIPCGIYGDRMRIGMMLEDIDTIEKSMKEIVSLGAEGEKNYNQIVRWVNNKEEHAGKVQEIVTGYFLAQRIKADQPTREEYYSRLALLHGLLVEAMKAKQTTDLGHVELLRRLVKEFSEVYFSAEDMKHLREEHGELQ